ncbi:MAG: hypothetical protein AB1465_06005 [Patescibacteria group bacterium]
MKTKKPKITLEKLAQMINKGFETTATKTDLETVKTEVKEIKAEMVTKTFLEDKLADLEGNVVLRQRKEDKKVNMIIEFLKKKKILTSAETRMLQEIKVFPSLK